MTAKEKRNEIYKSLESQGATFDKGILSQMIQEYAKFVSDNNGKQLAIACKKVGELKRQLKDSRTSRPQKYPKKIIKKAMPNKKYDLSDVKPSFFIK